MSHYVRDSAGTRVSAIREWRCQSLVVTVLAWILLVSASYGGGRGRLVEVSSDISSYTGKVVSRDATTVVLMDRFGAMSDVPISELHSFKVLSENYSACSPAEFRQQLLKEFPAGYEVTGSAHYVVCGKKGRTQAYADLFEGVFRQISSFYSLRGFDTTEPETALVAIVFSTQEEFREYCERDQMAWSETLRGYYSLKTNRVALYDDPTLLNSVTQTTVDSPALSLDAAALNSSITGETANTIIHETTHQVGFNIGIHSRVGQTPVWLVEGLAMVLEAPGMRTRGKSAESARVNGGRLQWFSGEYESRRQAGDLARLVASDDMFSNATLDAYSCSWAMTYLMTENPARARQFVSYLKSIAERDAATEYSAEERLKDFTDAFGDIARMEVDLLRLMNRLATP